MGAGAEAYEHTCKSNDRDKAITLYCKTLIRKSAILISIHVQKNLRGGDKEI